MRGEQESFRSSKSSSTRHVETRSSAVLSSRSRVSLAQMPVGALLEAVSLLHANTRASVACDVVSRTRVKAAGVTVWEARSRGC